MGGKKNKKPETTKRTNPNTTSETTKQQSNPQKQAEINKILQAVNGMDLNQTEFIDIKSFDEGKQILINAIDDLSSYIKLFKAGDYSKFPAPSNVEKTDKVEAK